MKNYFKKREKILWLVSVLLILVSFLFFDRENYAALSASLIGATAIILCAKGNPLGQVLMIIFSTIYGIISLTYRYYGEVITYVGMTLPMSLTALVSWLKHPYEGKHSEVEVSTVSKKDVLRIFLLAVPLTIVLYFVLKYLGTENIVVSTVSVTTSFIAVYLTYKRSPYFALAYAVNDLVLITLWILASIQDITYLSVVVCFVVFLINDIYGFYNWRKMQKRQKR